MVTRALSLRSRLAGTMALLFLTGTVVLYFAAFAYARTAADNSYDRLLIGSALSIAETLGVSPGGIVVDVPYAALDMLSAAPEDKVFYRVYSSNGQTITGYPDLPQEASSGSRVWLTPRYRGAMQPAPRFFDASYRGEAVRFVVLGRMVTELDGGSSIWVQVGQTRRARSAMTDELVLHAVLPIALMTGLALSLVWFGIGRALKPLEKIGRDLTSREPSDLRPVGAPVPIEVAPLVDAINGFMLRLEDSLRRLRAFVGEAAHQMRTPLAALRAQAQLALDENPDQMRRGLAAVERNAAKLTRLLNQMLSDATVGHRSSERRFESFDLLDLVREATHEALPVESRDRIDVDSPLEHARVLGDPLMLAEAVKNLIENACQHGGGDIELRVEAHGGGYVLTVSDRGPGIDSADREKVFDRFVRGADGTAGAGLGLAIVRRAVEGHGGKVDLQDRPGGGLSVVVTLPGGRA